MRVVSAGELSVFEGPYLMSKHAQDVVDDRGDETGGRKKSNVLSTSPARNCNSFSSSPRTLGTPIPPVVAAALVSRRLLLLLRRRASRSFIIRPTRRFTLYYSFKISIHRDGHRDAEGCSSNRQYVVILSRPKKRLCSTLFVNKFKTLGDISELCTKI